MKKTKPEKVIVLKQEPVLSYDLVETKGREVTEMINALALDDIESSEYNLKLLKATRTALKKEFEAFENQRKMVKELVMKPYNDFDEKYKKHISSLFKDADVKLKDKVYTVEDEILKRKIDRIRDYFDETNKYDFITFDDLELKVTKSTPDKRVKEQINEYLSAVENNLKMIETLENKDRITVKYQIYKDLNRAISEAQIEVRLEREAREAEVKAQAESHEAKQKAHAQEAEAPKKFRVKFDVVGTKEEITELKKYINEKGLRYE